jgi:glycine cleavage system aminomethyltransferase T
MLHHGTNRQFDGLPAAGRCGWVWYAEDAERAAAYGDRIVERSDDDLAILDTSADNTADWLDELRREGIAVDDLDVDPDDPADAEPHQVLTGPAGSEIARRVRGAGFDAIRHWEDHPDAGEGFVVAVAGHPTKERK